MAWTLNGIRIFAQNKDDVSNQIIARLQPLSGGTVQQFFGYESTIVAITAIVVGQADCNALLALARSGTTHSLVGPEVSYGNFEVKKAVGKRQMVICQTIRVDLPEDSPVFLFEIELHAED